MGRPSQPGPFTLRRLGRRWRFQSFRHIRSVARRGPRGTVDYLDLMIALGLVECLRTAQGGLTPTYRNTDGATVKHQMDHLFVAPALAECLHTCTVGSPEIVF